MTLYKWSQTAASNATADSTCPFPEGMSPAALNDGTRGMMAAVAKWRDDLAPTIQVGGTSTALTLTTNQVFDSLANLANKEISFFSLSENGDSPTLNVDGLGTKPIVYDATGTAITAGTLLASSIYTVVYSPAGTGQFILKGFYGNRYNIPVGGMMDYIGSTVPNNAFVFPYGQAISRTTYATLFALVSTQYGAGDGSTTFNVPDLRGRVVAGKDDMGGSAASRLSGSGITSGGAVTLGGTGGAETKVLSTANLPAYTPSGSISTSVTTAGAVSQGFQSGGSTQAAVVNGLGNVSNNSPSVVTATATSTFTGTAQGGTSTAFSLLQPTIIANKLLRII